MKRTSVGAVLIVGKSFRNPDKRREKKMVAILNSKVYEVLFKKQYVNIAISQQSANRHIGTVAYYKESKMSAIKGVVAPDKRIFLRHFFGPSHQGVLDECLEWAKKEFKDYKGILESTSKKSPEIPE